MLPSSNLIDTYQKADALLAKGDLQQAADICKQMLESNPNFAYGYHLMSALFRTTGNIEKALTFTDLAIKLDSNVPSFYVQRGELLMALSCFDAAEDAFLKAYQLRPDSIQALLMCADACVKKNNYDRAAQLFMDARRACQTLEDAAQIDHHEGQYVLAMGQMDAAEALFDRVIAAKPNAPSGHMSKGRILLHQHRDREAEVCFIRALSCNPHLHEALHGMAVVNERQGQIDSAIAFAIQAVNANGSIFDSLLLLGHLLLRKQNWEGAEQIFKQALSVVPDDVLALKGYTQSVTLPRRLADVRVHVGSLLAARPDNRSLAFIRDALDGVHADHPPSDYISALFDALAIRYDYFLQSLDAYRPDHFAQMLKTLPSVAGRTDLSLLDLGCGSGSLAGVLMDVTEQRVGVDLSSRMLDIARMGQCYHDSYALDITEFAIGSDRMFDLVAVLDVLPYVGALQPFLRAARNLLASSSVLAFTIEQDHDARDFSLKPSGRFTHSARYVREMLSEQGYDVMHEEEILLRFESGQPVKGMVFAVRKMRVH